MEMPWLYRIEADGSIDEIHNVIRKIVCSELRDRT
jgi:hypothetical protein